MTRFSKKKIELLMKKKIAKICISVGWGAQLCFRSSTLQVTRFSKKKIELLMKKKIAKICISAGWKARSRFRSSTPQVTRCACTQMSQVLQESAVGEINVEEGEDCKLGDFLGVDFDFEEHDGHLNCEEWSDDECNAWFESQFEPLFKLLEHVKTVAQSCLAEKSDATEYNQLGVVFEVQRTTSLIHGLFSEMEQCNLWDAMRSLNSSILPHLHKFEDKADVGYIKSFMESLDETMNKTACSSIQEIANARTENETTRRMVKFVLGGEGPLERKMAITDRYVSKAQFAAEDEVDLNEWMDTFEASNGSKYITYLFENELNKFQNDRIFKLLDLGSCVADMQSKRKRQRKEGASSSRDCKGQDASFSRDHPKRQRSAPDFYGLGDRRDKSPKLDADWDELSSLEGDDSADEAYIDEEDADAEEVPPCSKKRSAKVVSCETEAVIEDDISTFGNIRRDIERQPGCSKWRTFVDNRWSDQFLADMEKIVHSAMIIATSSDTIKTEQWLELEMVGGDLFASCEVLEKRGSGLASREGGSSSGAQSKKVVVEFLYDPRKGGVPLPCFKFDTAFKCNQIKAVQFFLRALENNREYKAHIKINHLPILGDFNIERHSSPLLGLNSFAVGAEMLPFIWHMLNTNIADALPFQENKKRPIIKVDTFRSRRAKSVTLNGCFESKGGVIMACRRGVREILKTKCFMGLDGQHDEQSTKSGYEVGRVSYSHGGEEETKKIMKMYPGGTVTGTRRLRNLSDMQCNYTDDLSTEVGSVKSVVQVPSVEVEV